VKCVQANVPEELERMRRLARLKVARLREQRLNLDRRDLQKDPEYEPEPPEESVEES